MSVSFCEGCGSQFPGQELRPRPPAPAPAPAPHSPQPSPFGGVYSSSFAAPGYASSYSPTLMRRTSGMAIAGLVFSLLCGLLGLILSIMAYRECQDDEVDGEGMALAGIMISIANMFLGLVLHLSR